MKRTNCWLRSRKENTTTALAQPLYTTTTRKLKTSIHVTALDSIVNVNSLFTVAIFIGFSLTVPEGGSAGTEPECTASLETVRRLIVFEVVSFSFFLFSSLVAQSLKLWINLINSSDPDPHKADIDQRALKYGLVGSAVGSVVACIFLTLSIVYLIQVKLGVISCGGKTVWSIVALGLGVGLGLVVYVSTTAYALIFIKEDV
ncbi:hypothetical protein CDL12_10984 [Handroanthus impetiginosus]|uniref:Uncharacterized protein n=1 Tax=Handroanthus impetiginosus TaxID=429701 RepID=A0A2G9HFR6_9LAMI|nr:hypothetical protein CDL12_10984 [Handroanthus impetiginosus]